jgi:hypothetical protein
LLCDDIRIESNGKHLLIGVYSGIIKLRRPLPVKLPMLSFRIQMDLQKVDYGDYQLRVIDPRKRLAAQFRGLAQFARTDEPAVLICTSGPMILSSYGTHCLEFGMGGLLQPLGTFEVRAAQAESPLGATQPDYSLSAGISRPH